MNLAAMTSSAACSSGRVCVVEVDVDHHGAFVQRDRPACWRIARL